MQTTTTTTTTTATTGLQTALQLNSEARNYANAAERIAANATLQLRQARKYYQLTADDDLALAHYAKGARAAAKKANEHAGSARVNMPGSYLHTYNTNRAAEMAAAAEKYADRLANHLAEIDLREDDGEGC